MKDFLLASRAAEQSLEFLAAARECVANGKESDARTCLEGIAAMASSKWARTLNGMGDELARVSDGTGAGNSPSAHAAVVALWNACELLLASACPPRDIANKFHARGLRGGLLRERAKMLATSAQEKENKAADPQPQNDSVDYRDGGPNGELLTTKCTKARYDVSAKDLACDEEAKRHRRKNPAGRNGGDYVYRYADVARIANRKNRDA